MADAQPNPPTPEPPQPHDAGPKGPRLAEADPGDVRTPVAISETKEAAPRAEPVVPNREQDRPVAEPAAGKEERADEGRADESRRQDEAPRGPSINPLVAGQGLARPRAFNPYDVKSSARPGQRLHGATDRFRQDVGLGPQDIVEQVIRTGMPAGGWIDFKVSEGYDDLLRRREGFGAAGKGINLVAGLGEAVDPMLVRELLAGTIPARLVRRGSHG